jgi:hypothetical protein
MDFSLLSIFKRLAKSFFKNKFGNYFRKNSNSNSFVFFVWQKMEFANSQINMGKRKKGYLQQFGKIDLPKSKKGNPAARERRAHAGVARETECQADRELAYMPIHPRILSS